MQIGLFFGSFNPIHMGHLIIAQSMLGKSSLQQIWFVVSPQNPFKKKSSLLHEFDRFDIIEQAIADNPDLKVSDIEFHLPKPSYTIDSLSYIQEKYPQHSFALIMGSDNLSHFHKWKNYAQILEYYQIYVYPRPDTQASQFDQHPKVTFVEAPLLNISATYIRNLIKEEKSIKYLVHEAVESFILRKKFYL